MKNIAAYIALNRFGLGVAPGEADAVDADPRGWIRNQIVRRQEVPVDADPAFHPSPAPPPS